MTFVHDIPEAGVYRRSDGVPWVSMTAVLVEPTDVQWSQTITLTPPLATSTFPIGARITVPVTLTGVPVETGTFQFFTTDAAGQSSPLSGPVTSPSTLSPNSGPLSVDTLKTEYLDIQKDGDDPFLGRMLAGCYAFALSYTGRTEADPVPADLEDALYTHAARNYRERDAMYSDQVVLTDQGGVVNYFRSMPPRVKATYDLYRSQRPLRLT